VNGRERPTAPFGRVDVSPVSTRASAAPASREELLWKGYARVGPFRRTESCECGEDIVAEVGWEAAAVDEHNAGARHQAWRAR